MMIVSSLENIRKLDRYKEISQKLAHAEGLTDEQARVLARDGKPVIWIDGGLHASETVGSQQLMETVYQMASRTDPETIHLLNETIALYVQANPDGQEFVADWYMREKEETKRSLQGLPKLYNKYIGHDDNRDFYMSNMPETTNMNRQMFIEWFPQIVYNHHQTGPAGAVIFMPPFRDPFNYNLDPLIPLGIEGVGTAMHRASHDSVFSQHDRPAHRDNRRPNPDGSFAGGFEAVANRRLAASDRTPKVALSPVDRLRA
jgi:hypothetical protein